MSTNKSRVLTLDTVLAEEPCGFYRRQFTDRFPVSVEVTTELAKSQAGEWDWFWAAEMLLSYEGFQMWKETNRAARTTQEDSLLPYQTATSAEFEKADEEYYRVRTEVYEETGSWDEAYQMGHKAYQKISTLPRAVMEVARKVAEEIYNETIAVKWAEIYIAEGENNDAS